MSDGWGSANGWGGPEQQVVSQPDWTAMAEQHEREQRRRRQRQVVIAAAVGTLAIGGITATAVLAGGSGKPSTSKVALDGASASATDTAPNDPSAAPAGSPTASPSASASGSPTATASASGKPSPKAPSGSTAAPTPDTPPDPLTLISSAATDTAPITPESLFPAATLSSGGKTWTRVVTGTTTTCWQATTGHLGDVLTAQNCRQLLRATYTSGNSAVTIGIAVMDSKAQADGAFAANQGQVQGLVPTGTTSYCTGTGCANTHASIGRYTYYTVQGTVKPGGNAPDATANAAAPDFAAYARAQLLARGQKH